MVSACLIARKYLLSNKNQEYSASNFHRNCFITDILYNRCVFRFLGIERYIQYQHSDLVKCHHIKNMAILKKILRYHRLNYSILFYFSSRSRYQILLEKCKYS